MARRSRAVLGVMRVVEKLVLSFSDGRRDPHVDVGGNHVHEPEPHNGHASLDNDLQAHTVDRRPTSNLHASTDAELTA